MNRSKNRQLRTSRDDDWLFLLMVGIAFLTALVYVFTTPLWQAPDEQSHLAFIDYVQKSGSLPSPLISHVSKPIQRSARETLHWPAISSPLPRRPKVLPAEDFAYRDLIYTANHPPLYYLAAFPFAALGARLAPKPIVGLAYGARIFSALLASLTVGLAYLTGRRLELPSGESAVIALLILLQPQFMFIATSINNDSLTVFLFSLLLLYLLIEIQQTGFGGPLRLGIVLGLGLLTKVTFFLGLPLTFLALWLGSDRLAPSYTVLTRFVSTTIIAAAISGWWFARNVTLYGSFWYVIGGTGLGRAKLAEFVTVSRFYQWLFKSYWGFFGWMQKPLPAFFFTMLLALGLAASAGIVLKIFSRTSRRPSWYRRSLIFLLLVPITIFIGAIWFRVVALTGQGRYLFPGIIPATILLWLGLKSWLGDRLRAPLAAMLIGFFAAMSYTGLSLIRQL